MIPDRRVNREGKAIQVDFTRPRSSTESFVELFVEGLGGSLPPARREVAVPNVPIHVVAKHTDVMSNRAI
jgi:hypothetical protein